ncbi:hypothetical protein PROFUN_06211 [Planoprotostelium fungivorum]|uniref:AD domain-containing protein n=1 Tax=Planoprotostelium fungivorum TaxID=1890364 RepID=A0A2P6MZ14_9EUKA|nr:hypothetical protein PROFUN_06211 [Planoprotostelium fungivorum]
MESFIGLHVQIKTLSDDTLEGEIFSYDSNTGCVVLSTSLVHTTMKKTLNIIKTSHIKDIQYIGKGTTTNLRLPSVDVTKIRNKEDIAVRTAKEEQLRIGVNVSKEAQDIFNALSKTLPCRWDGDTIIVLDEIYIRNPYGNTNCQGNNTVMLERVRKVLDGEKKRMVK